MIEIPTQVRNCCPICKADFGLFYLPFTEEAMEKSGEFKLNQIIRSVLYGVKKPRSVLQLKRFWGMCSIVASNTDDKGFNSKEKVAEQIKIALDFVNQDLIIVKPNGDVHIPYRSISFKDLPHMEACRFFERADDIFKTICKKLGIDYRILEKEAERG